MWHTCLHSVRQPSAYTASRQAEQCQPKRVTQDIAINKHAFIRVHMHPKRFPAVYTVEWQECVIYNGADYVVIHKPAGVQVAPTVDNLLENVLFCTAQRDCWWWGVIAPLSNTSTGCCNGPGLSGSSTRL